MYTSWAKLLALYFIGSSQANNIYNASHMQPFHIDLLARVPRMLEQIRSTQLPTEPVYVDTGNAKGITLHDLKSFKAEWLTGFDWESEEKDLNKYTR